MIRRAVFCWWSGGRRAGGGRTVWSMQLWLHAVLRARESFDEVILMADAPGRELLVDALALPFSRVVPMPDLPPAVGGVYALGKLAAHAWAAGEGVPYVLMDHDAWWEMPPPARLLGAGACGQEWYPVDAARRRLHAALAGGPEIGERAMTAGFLGGCDTDGLGAWAGRSLAVAVHDANRAVLGATLQAGFIGACVLEECAFGAAFPQAEPLFLEPSTAAMRERVGYVHVAGLKSDAGTHALLDSVLRDAYPAERLAFRRRYAACTFSAAISAD